MSISGERVTIPAKFCVCEKCHRSWLSILKHLPERCPSRQCRSREWNGPKRPSHVNEIELPVPRPPGRPKAVVLIDDDGEDEF